MKRNDLYTVGCLLACSLLLSACGSITGGSEANIYNGAVFIADRETAGVNELFISDSETAEISKLSAALTTGGNVKSFKVNSNIGFITYLADQDIDGVDELFYIKQSVGVPTKVNAELSVGQNVSSYEWSPDGIYMAYIADQDTPGINELYVSDGKTSYKVSATGLTRNVIDYKWSPDSDSIAYSAQQTPTSTTEIYVSQSDGNVIATQVSDSSSIGSGIVDYEWAPDSSLIAYLADQDTTGVTELYTTSVDVITSTTISVLTDGDVQAFKWGNSSTLLAYTANPAATDDTNLFITVTDNNTSVIQASNVVLNGVVTSDFLWAPNDTYLAYVADQETDDVFELYITAFDGSVVGVKVSAALTTGGDVDTSEGFVWGTLSNQIVYRADQDTDEVFELYSSTTDGEASTTGVKISGDLVAGGSIKSDFKLSPFGSIVAYVADLETDGVFNLYATTLEEGGTDDARLSANTDAANAVFQYAWSTDGNKVFYIADQDVDGLNDAYTAAIADLAILNLSSSPASGTGITQGVFIDTFGVTDNLFPL